MPLDDQPSWALLRELDDPDHLEFPRGYNHTASRARFNQLADRLNLRFDCICTDAALPQHLRTRGTPRPGTEPDADAAHPRLRLLAAGLDRLPRPGWGPTSIPLIAGTPDVDGDSRPDFWTLFSDGKVYLYPGGSNWHGTRRLVISGDTAEGTNWSRPVALG
ncbi:hypothetical protein [Streptomyces chengmaiensis]|uniref:hypothetical protein n=1 Tax=Streptomyces chengmaiensis TaxID=3040919 RepID=UPI0037D9CF2F